jgi:hypothetical protein
MRFPWRSRSRVEVLQAVHDDVAHARDELRATVADAVAVAEGRLRKELDLREEMCELVERLDATSSQIHAHDADVLHALTRVAGACELLARRMEEDRDERRLLIGAIELLATALPAMSAPQPLRPARERVLGGTVDAARAPQLDLTGDAPAEPPAPTWTRRAEY